MSSRARLFGAKHVANCLSSYRSKRHLYIPSTNMERYLRNVEHKLLLLEFHLMLQIHFLFFTMSMQRMLDVRGIVINGAFVAAHYTLFYISFKTCCVKVPYEWICIGANKWPFVPFNMHKWGFRVKNVLGLCCTSAKFGGYLLFITYGK